MSDEKNGKPAGDGENPDEERQRQGLDFLVGVADTRIQAYMDANLPAIVQNVVDQVVEQLGDKLDPQAIAIRAERIFEQRWNEEARKRQAARAGDGGGGGGDKNPPTSSGGGEGGDGDASFLNDVDGSAPQSMYPAAANARQAVAVGGLRLMEDPLGSVERMLNMVFDVMDRRRPQTQRHDLDVIEDIATRRPYLVDIFASQDPAAAPEKLAHAMMDGARSGMSVAEAYAKYTMRDATRKPPPKWKPPEIDVPKSEERVKPPAPAEPAAQASGEPVAPMGQDRVRRRRGLRDIA